MTKLVINKKTLTSFIIDDSETNKVVYTDKLPPLPKGWVRRPKIDEEEFEEIYNNVLIKLSQTVFDSDTEDYLVKMNVFQNYDKLREELRNCLYKIKDKDNIENIIKNMNMLNVK